MASAAASAIAPQEKRRKQLTYGKRGRNSAQQLASSFERLGQITPKKSPSRLRVPSTSPSSRAVSETANARSAFDVPSSEDEASTPGPSPAKNLVSEQISKRKTLSAPTSKLASLRASRQASPDPFDVPPSDGEARRKVQSTSSGARRANVGRQAKSSKKRKRGEEKRGQAFGMSEDEHNRQVQLQIQKEISDTSAGVCGRNIASNEMSDVAIRSPRDRALEKKSNTNVVSEDDVDAPTFKQDMLDLNGQPCLEPVVVIPSPVSQRRHKELIRDVSQSPPELNTHQPPSTPPEQVSSSSQTHSPLNLITSPQQSMAWQGLLGDKASETPSKGLETLAITSKSGKRPGKVRQKLVDTLKARSESSITSGESNGEGDVDPASGTDRMDFEEGVDVKESSLAKLTGNSSSQPIRTHENGPRITYAQQRSYLADAPDSLDAFLAQPIESPASLPTQIGRQRHAAVSSKQSEPHDEQLSDDEGGKAIRGIHELRAAKSLRRIADELDALQIDLAEGSTLSTKRSALLDLSKKFLNTEFRDKFTQHGFVYQIFKECSAETDPIVCSSAAACMALVIGNDADYQTASQFYEAGMIQTLSEIIDSESTLISMAKDRGSNMSKYAQGSVKEFSENMRESSIWQSHHHFDTLTPQIIALRSTELLVRKLREGGNGDVILDESMLDKLLDVMKAVPTLPRNDTTTNKDQSSLVKLELVLSILESMTIVPSCALDKSLWNESILDQLVDHMEQAIPWTVQESSGVQALALRLCLNLANNNKRNSDSFARPKFVSKLVSFINSGFDGLEDLVLSETNTQAFDNLLLGLGTMINLAEWSDAARQSVRAQGDAQTRKMVQTFLSGRSKASEADSIEASRANIPYGYLAILLGDLCQDRDVRLLVRDVMPKRRLDPIIEAVEEFITVHKEADRREQGNDHWVAFTNRLQEVANTLRGFDELE